MNRIKLESFTVSKLQEAISRSKTLHPIFDTNDKTPSWDGNIFVYNTINNEEFKKSDLFGKIPVQIKGTTVKKINAKFINYRVSTEDLNNYLNDGGVIYFVVQCTDAFDYKIYYTCLLPLYITKLISNSEGKKTISITLDWFNENGKVSLDTICHNFINDRKLQYSTVSGNTSNILIKNNLPNFDEYSFHFKTFEAPIFDSLLNMPIYLYGKNKKDVIATPIDRIKIETITQTLNKTISINGNIYYNTFNIIFSNEEHIIAIGKGIKFKLSQGKFDYCINGNLSERLNDTKFIIALIESHQVDFDKINFTIGDEADSSLEDIKNLNSYLSNLVTLMNYFNVEEDLNMDNLSPSDYEKLNSLIDIVLYNKKVKNEQIDTGIIKLEIINMCFLIYIEKDKDSNLIIRNMKSDEARNFILYFKENEESHEYFPCSKYLLLNTEEMSKCNNIDYIEIANSIKDIKPTNVLMIDRNILFLLELIKTYDNNKNIHTLLASLDICEWIEKFETRPIIIHMINKLQIQRRLRRLTTEENEYIYEKRKEIDSKTEYENKEMHLAALSILLENEKDFEYYYGKMSETEKIQFSSYPIYNLKNLVD